MWMSLDEQEETELTGVASVPSVCIRISLSLCLFPSHSPTLCIVMINKRITSKKARYVSLSALVLGGHFNGVFV